MAIVEKRLQEWEGVWQCTAEVAGEWQVDKGGELEPLTAANIAATKRVFKERTATAVDSSHPKSYGAASEELQLATGKLASPAASSVALQLLAAVVPALGEYPSLLGRYWVPTCL